MILFPAGSGLKSESRKTIRIIVWHTTREASILSRFAECRHKTGGMHIVHLLSPAPSSSSPVYHHPDWERKGSVLGRPPNCSVYKQAYKPNVEAGERNGSVLGCPPNCSVYKQAYKPNVEKGETKSNVLECPPNCSVYKQAYKPNVEVSEPVWPSGKALDR